MGERLLYSLAVSLALTLVFELSMALLWGLRTRLQLRLVVLANCLTNPPLVLCVLLWRTAPVLLLETAAVLVEGLCYRSCRVGIRRPFCFSLAANCFSYFTGLILRYLV